MTYLMTTYCLYIILVCVIIFWAGSRLHQGGRFFVLEAFDQDKEKTDLTNNLLLLGYYLVNVGYSFVILPRLPPVRSASQILEALSHQIGFLILLLAILHYCNLFILILIILIKRKKPSFTQ